MITQTSSFTRRNEFWDGVKTTLPLVVGAIPFGIIFGAVAIANGISPGGSQSMSLFVFAGSAQFVAAGLVASGTSILIIIGTTFIVNFRHALYAATLAPHMKNLPQRWLIPLGFWLTDESFVVVSQRYQQSDKSIYKHWFFFGSAISMYTNWQICTFIGIKAGQAINDPLSWGLDFAIVVTFIGMLVPMAINWSARATIIISGSAALLTHNMPHNLGLIISAILGITVGVIIENLFLTKKIPEKKNE